jgi:hypothetical protein
MHIPKSPTAPVALAYGWTGFGWKARGSGTIDTVSKQMWELFQERAERGEKILMQTPPEVPRCPEHYHILQGVAVAQAWGKERYQKLFEEAIKAEPAFTSFYFGRCVYLFATFATFQRLVESLRIFWCPRPFGPSKSNLLTSGL